MLQRPKYLQHFFCQQMNCGGVNLLHLHNMSPHSQTPILLLRPKHPFGDYLIRAVTFYISNEHYLGINLNYILCVYLRDPSCSSCIQGGMKGLKTKCYNNLM